MKTIKISLVFPYPCDDSWSIVLAAIKKELPDIKVTKIRYSYFESNYGFCDFPAGIMLSQLMDKNGPVRSFDSHINKCSGEYELKFEE